MAKVDASETSEIGTSSVFDPEKLTAEELTKKIEEAGCPIGSVLIENRITGDLLRQIGQDEYKMLGVPFVGDYLRLKKAVGHLQMQARAARRNTIIWKAEEYDPDNRCCGLPCCPIQPTGNVFKLTPSTLIIETRLPVFCCGVLCKGTVASVVRSVNGEQTAVDNIKLGMIEDVDMGQLKPGCCAAMCGDAPIDGIHVTMKSTGANQGKKYSFFIEGGKGIEAQQMIRDAIDESMAEAAAPK